MEPCLFGYRMPCFFLNFSLIIQCEDRKIDLRRSALECDMLNLQECNQKIPVGKCVLYLI